MTHVTCSALFFARTRVIYMKFSLHVFVHVFQFSIGALNLLYNGQLLLLLAMCVSKVGRWSLPHGFVNTPH